MKTKTKISLLITMLIVAILSSTVYAQSSFKTSLIASQTETTIGEEISVTLKITDMLEIGEGLSSFQGVLEFDKDVFEEIQPDSNGYTTSFTKLDNWDTPVYNAQNGKFVMSGASVKTDSNVIKITLKVKSDAKEGNTTIKIKECMGSNGEQDITGTNSETTIEIIKPTVEPRVDNNTIDNTVNNNVNNNTVKNNTIQNNTVKNNTTKNNITTTSSNNKSTTAKTTTSATLPKTGSSIIILVVGILISVNALIVYRKYKKS